MEPVVLESLFLMNLIAKVIQVGVAMENRNWHTQIPGYFNKSDENESSEDGALKKQLFALTLSHLLDSFPENLKSHLSTKTLSNKNILA